MTTGPAWSRRFLEKIPRRFWIFSRKIIAHRIERKIGTSLITIFEIVSMASRRTSLRSLKREAKALAIASSVSSGNVNAADAAMCLPSVTPAQSKKKRRRSDLDSLGPIWSDEKYANETLKHPGGTRRMRSET